MATDVLEMYCVKCRDKREMKNAHQMTMKNGRRAVQGQCTVCGTSLTRPLEKPQRM